MENLSYYEQLRQVPQEAQKQFNNGRFKGTDINPMWRIKRLTEVFGPCGLGWFVEVTDRHMEKSPSGEEIAAFVAIKLYVKYNGEWSAPIYGEGGNIFFGGNQGKRISDEAYKMAYTDAFSNAAKQLGLGADIWFANDRTKYTQEPQGIVASGRKSQEEIDVAQVDFAALKILDGARAAITIKQLISNKNLQYLVCLAKRLQAEMPELWELVQAEFTKRRKELQA